MALLGSCAGTDIDRPARSEPGIGGGPAVVADEDYFPGAGNSSIDVQSYDLTASLTIEGSDQIELGLLLGGEAFGELLRAWLDERAGATGTTEQFLDLAGRTHGDAGAVRELAEPWLFGDELPELSF